MSAPSGRSAVPQLLLELVTNPLDPGYAAAARRRGAEPAPRHARSTAAVMVALGCLLAGFVLVVAYQHTHRGAPAAQKAHDRLVARVRDEQRATAGLASRAAAQESQLERLRSQALGGSGARELSAYTLAAGLTKVTGPGMTVTLSDPKAPATTAPVQRPGSVPISATATLTDRDVRSVVNELWHDGAEAIAVNGVRLTPLSAIRFAGQAVLVDFQPITSPYRISAIGNADAMSVAFADSEVASRYQQTLVGSEGIGFHFGESSSLTLPAGTTSTLHYAHAAGRRK